MELRWLLIVLSLLLLFAVETTGQESGVDNVFNSCFHVPNNICFDGNSQILSGRPSPADLVGWWSFDWKHPVDDSGNGNHFHPSIRAGPSFHSGSSAALSPSTDASAKDSPSMQVSDFTLAGWIYLLEGSKVTARSIVSKGSNLEVFLEARSRNITARVGDSKITSRAIVPMRRWTHIAVSSKNGLNTLFINSIPDTKLPGGPVTASGDLHLGGGGPLGKKTAELYLDDLRLYRRALTQGEISALTTATVTGMSSTDIVTIGCEACGYEEAMEPSTCSPPFHLCTLEESFFGALHVARIQGWLSRGGGDIWFADMMPTEAEMEGVTKRLALCCRGAPAESHPSQ